ncbi:MAG: GtrA family protein [Clostridia bacterium]
MVKTRDADVKNSVMQFVKFNLVGVINSAVDFGIYTLLTLLGLNYIISQVISYSCGVANSYLWNSSWTFKEQRKRNWREIALFILVNLVALGTSTLALYICREKFNVQNELLCKLISMPCAIIVNFFGNKLIVFNDNKH